MRIVPAVDIRGGLVVNLVQGDYDRETVFERDPVAQVVKWRDRGAELVHIVDLDGAKEGRCCVEPFLRRMAEAGVSFEVGGGIRDLETITRIMDAGAARVILGTAAYRDPVLLAEASLKHPGHVAVGIDAKEGKVALSAWLDVTQTDAIPFAVDAAKSGAARIIYTDILSDGMMKGPNYAGTRAMAQATAIPVTASGGIASLDDVRRLCELERDGVDEMIIGRALYVGAFTLEEAIGIAREHSE